jgi:hypothetical protein
MTKLRIDEIQGQVIRQASDEVEHLKRRKELNQVSGFDRESPETFSGIGRHDLSALKKQDGAPSTIGNDASQKAVYALADGQTLELPRLSESDREKIAATFATIDPAKRPQLEQAGMGLGAAIFAELEGKPIGVAVSSISAGLQSSIDQTYETYLLTTGQSNASNATEGVLFAGMNGVEQNLYDFFEEVQDRQSQANELRTDITELESMLAEWPDGQETQLFSWHEIVFSEDGTTTVVEHKNEPLTKEQAQELLDKLNTQQDSMSTISTQDQFKLQQMTEKYQQAMETLSNILKSQDDTQKGIISNIKA